MNKELLTDALLREFLLGKVDDDERKRIEDLFLTDSEVRERVLVVEQELVEDYVEENLTVADRDEFLLRYGQTSAQQQQLRISKAIKDWALRENAKNQLAAGSWWDRLCGKLGLKPAFVIPIAATAIIAVVVGAFWLNSRMTRAALAKELAQLNTPVSLRETPPQMQSLNLSPVTVRSAAPSTSVLKRSAATGIVELRLPWIQKERYSTYRAELRRVGADESVAIPNLQAESDVQSTIRLRLPARLLTRGQYQIDLTGVADDGRTSPSEEYTLSVEDQVADKR